MKKVIYIGLKDLIITLRDKKALAFIILMPIALIGVLGLSLSSIFKSSFDYNFTKFDVAVADKDNGEYSKKFKDFLKSKDIKKLINLKEMSESSADKEIKNGTLSVLIVIPKGYSKNSYDGKKAELKIYSDPSKNIDAKIVESFVKSYTGVVSSSTAAVYAADSQFKKYGLDGRMILPKILASSDNNSSKLSESNVKPKESLSAIQYYSAAMLVMFILFVGILGTQSMLLEREEGTLSRIMGTRAAKRQILLGKMLGIFFIGVFDVVVLIAFTKIVFKVSWGNSILGIIVLSLAMIFAACGFGMFMATIFKTSKAADMSSSVIIMIMSFMGGSMYPIYEMPAGMQKAAGLMLNNWALKGYLKLMTGNGIGSIATPCLVLCIFGIVLLSIGHFKFKFE